MKETAFFCLRLAPVAFSQSSTATTKLHAETPTQPVALQSLFCSPFNTCAYLAQRHILDRQLRPSGKPMRFDCMYVNRVTEPEAGQTSISTPLIGERETVKIFSLHNSYRAA